MENFETFRGFKRELSDTTAKVQKMKTDLMILEHKQPTLDMDASKAKYLQKKDWKKKEEEMEERVAILKPLIKELPDLAAGRSYSHACEHSSGMAGGRLCKEFDEEISRPMDLNKISLRLSFKGYPSLQGQKYPSGRLGAFIDVIC